MDLSPSISNFTPPWPTRIEVPVEFAIGAPGSAAIARRELDSRECQLAAGAAAQGLQPLAMDSPVKVEARS